mmetsp:Transcript_10407/g.32812  ORF Transcript_10407/g.32812 Transcript_10407/m.32812 type:complete len:227 (+) Transcript_10407:777-1457(+)
MVCCASGSVRTRSAIESARSAHATSAAVVCAGTWTVTMTSLPASAQLSGAGWATAAAGVPAPMLASHTLAAPAGPAATLPLDRPAAATSSAKACSRRLSAIFTASWMPCATSERLASCACSRNSREAISAGAKSSASTSTPLRSMSSRTRATKHGPRSVVGTPHAAVSRVARSFGGRPLSEPLASKSKMAATGVPMPGESTSVAIACSCRTRAKSVSGTSSGCAND